MSWTKGRKRSICKKIYFTESEWKEAKCFYEKTRFGSRSTSFNQHARELLMWGNITEIVVPIRPETVRGEIRKIGSNINQIAHVANATNSVSDKQIKALLEQQDRLWKLFLDLNDEYNRKVA